MTILRRSLEPEIPLGGDYQGHVTTTWIFLFGVPSFEPVVQPRSSATPEPVVRPVDYIAVILVTSWQMPWHRRGGQWMGQAFPQPCRRRWTARLLEELRR